jgi:hypothetical protein
VKKYDVLKKVLSKIPCFLVIGSQTTVMDYEERHQTFIRTYMIPSEENIDTFHRDMNAQASVFIL